MTSHQRRDLVIAIDYYDGEAEGFASCEGSCTYFLRISTDRDDVNEYLSVSIDCVWFDEIASLLGYADSPKQVFVYSSANECVNRRLDARVPTLRTEIDRMGRRVRGRTYLEAISSAEH